MDEGKVKDNKNQAETLSKEIQELVKKFDKDIKKLGLERGLKLDTEVQIKILGKFKKD